jgi:hypothetical protein
MMKEPNGEYRRNLQEEAEQNLVSGLFLQQKGSRNGTLLAVLKASGQPVTCW